MSVGVHPPKSRWLAAMVLAALVAAGGAAWALVSRAPQVVASGGGRSLVKVSGGLLAHEPFDHALALRNIEDDFELNGSAPPGAGFASLSATGLHVGVRPHGNLFYGWFAVPTRAFPASAVYHVEMARPPVPVRGSGNQGEGVFAVQTATTKRTGVINYVVVASNSAGGVTDWMIGYAHGRLQNATLDTLATLPASAASANGQEVNVSTDGSHSLRVWFGDKLVYGSDHLSLRIAPPFQPYLEVQARRIGYVATFRDFSVTASSTVEVDGLRAGQTVALTDRSGRVLALTKAARSGVAALDVAAQPQGEGFLDVVSGAKSLRLGPFPYAGGDRYRMQ